MSQSEAFGFGFSNDYLLKHGNFFMKPSLHPDGFVYPAISEAARYQNHHHLLDDLPLDFAIKQEKPPTPPASTSPSSPRATSPSSQNGVSKHATWIAGKQKLSWDGSTVASYNPDTKMFRCVVCNAVGFLSRIAEHYLGTHTSAKVFQCLHCPYSSTWSRCVRMHMTKHHGVPNAPPSLWKGQPLLEEIFQLLTNLKTAVDSQGRERLDPELADKKFVCPKCPYTTDRRDLYLRHENIHKEDKPYHCYVCFKLFNRADHVKKHFLRIHRGHPYDISLVRRRPSRIPTTPGNKPNNSNFSVDKLIANGDAADAKTDAIDLSIGGGADVMNKNHPQQKTFQCPHCEWEGVDSWCLRRHMNVHAKSFECPSCDFKAGKAERLFTHVFKAHKMLVCTKCRFQTDQAQDFEVHIKDCCLEMVIGGTYDKLCDDSPTESDDAASLDVKFEPSFLLPKLFDHHPRLDLKGSVSLAPLHNSISYCFPGAEEGLVGATPLVLVDERPTNLCKTDIKPELASPVQSSSDSGVADVTSDHASDQDIACFRCGCEFADHASLRTHTELHHPPSPTTPSATQKKKKKKFSCAICNFHSDRQRTILEHMRFHTGEVLQCRACAFRAVCDSTLERHVAAEHCDGATRCPHCALPCPEKVPFIRHYRRCHHSRSCHRCRQIKRGLDPKTTTTPPLAILEASKEVVQPYLHHNPYSKRTNGLFPYCSAPSSTVAVAIAPSLQRTAEVASDLFPKKSSRKQTTPRKLANPPADPTRVCDRQRPKVKRSRKVVARRALWHCAQGHAKPVPFRVGSNYVRHLYWHHHAMRHRCGQCDARFRRVYQVLLHRRSVHEQ